MGAVATLRHPHRNAIVAGWRKPEFCAKAAVFVGVLGKEVAPLAWLADDVPVLHLVAINSTLPVAQIRAVVEFNKPIGIVTRENGIGLDRRNFADEDVSPADFAAVGLKLNRSAGWDGVGGKSH